MQTKTELTLEQTQLGASDEVLKIRVIPYSIHNDNGNPTSANIKQALRNLQIAQRVRDVYVLEMTSSAQESCFFAKAFNNINWLRHKKLAHLNFKTINKLAKQNLVIDLLSLFYSKDKPCSSYKKGKHHRANFKTKQISSIKKCLHLLHMDLFRPVTPRVFNIRRQQTEETYHITFDESPDAINFSKPLVDDINIAETERYPPDEYLHPYEPSKILMVLEFKKKFLESTADYRQEGKVMARTSKNCRGHQGFLVVNRLEFHYFWFVMDVLISAANVPCCC
ncbi:retrovirus-related pol polyprotein from transposon TNT 1-94 [Tanacetum coccineum]